MATSEHPDRPTDHSIYMPTPDQYVRALGGAPVEEAEPALEQPERPRIKRRLPQPPRRRHRGVVAVLLILLLAVLGYVGYIAYNVAKISTKPLVLSGMMADASGRTNILVLGVGDPGHSGQALSDTMMVISLDAKTKRVAQISIPRDLRVNIPGSGRGKINSANAIGGTQLAEDVVSQTLGIPIHYYVETNFTGLKGLVDAVGGIDVDVKNRLRDTQYPCDDNQYRVCGLDIEPGLQHMDGTTALKYVRCRKGTCGDDFGRAKRQQEVIDLVRAKVVRVDVLANPAKLTPVITAVRSGVETDLGAVQLVELVSRWETATKSQPPLRFVLSTATGGLLVSSGTSDLLPVGGDFSAIQEQVQSIFTNPPDQPAS